MRRFKILTILALGFAAIVAQPTFAVDPVITFGFTDLVGSFTQQSMLFTAVNDADTDGDVTRVDVDPDDTALFDGVGAPYGFFSIMMSVTSTRGDTIASENGSFVITDLDGDMIIGNIAHGVWVNNGSANFYGNLTDVSIVPDNAQIADAEFNGIDGTSFSLEGLPDVLEGNVMTLVFGNWFDNDFDDASTLAQGAIIPEPATLALLAFGILPVVGRRRR